MHLARRAYVLVILTAVLAIVGIWSSERGYAHLWQLPAALLLLGLAVESVLVRRAPPEAQIDTAARAFLGRPQAAAFSFANPGPRPLALEYAPATPAGFAPLAGVRRVVAAARGTVADAVTLVPVRLGPQRWPTLPARSALCARLVGDHAAAAARLVVAPDACARGRRCAAWRAGRARAGSPGPAPSCTSCVITRRGTRSHGLTGRQRRAPARW
jgi:hypothetical protein